MQLVKFVQSYRSYAVGETARFDKDQAESLKGAGLVEFVAAKKGQ